MSIAYESDATPVTTGEFRQYPKVLRLHLAIINEEEGGYSVIVLNLPGAGSCGDTESEAIENAKEAVSGLIESYKDDGEDVPWASVNEYDLPENSRQKWILMNA